MKNEDTKKNATRMRLFTDVLRELGEGSVADEATYRLQELTEAVARMGKGGTLTLTLSVKPAPNSSIAFVVSHDIKVKKPEAPKEATVMFVNDDFNLQRNHPKQIDMGLKVVSDGEDQEVRHVNQN